MELFQWTLSWEYLRTQIRILSKFDVPEAASLEILGLDPSGPMPRPSARISADQVLKVFNAAEAALNDPNIGLKVGNHFRVSGFGDTGGIFTHCENMRDVCDHNARYQPLAIDMARIWFSDDKDPQTGEKVYAHNYALYDHGGAADPDSYKHLIDLVFGAYGTAFRWLSWGSAKELQGINFQYARPRDADIYQTIFNCPVHFGQSHNALILDEDVALATISTFDPVKRAQMVARLDAILNAAIASESFASALSSTIRNQITLGRITRPLVISAMGLSQSRFAEALTSAGLSYKSEVNRVRKQMIEELLMTDKSFTEIAQTLGYNDQAAFNKAFTRLYGTSPTAFRAARASAS